MQFAYNIQAGENSLNIKDDIYRYIIKARRNSVGNKVSFRNLKDFFLYTYEISIISKKDAILTLVSKEEIVVEQEKKLHLLWSVVDPKTIEKQLPYLNEIGVDKITFVYADYSQKNFKLNFDKFEKIVINSSQQCGRSSIIKFEEVNNIESFLEKSPNTFILNFSDKVIDEVTNIEVMAIGCEGGFSKREIELFEKKQIIGLKSNLILRSETAIMAVSSKILL